MKATTPVIKQPPRGEPWSLSPDIPVLTSHETLKVRRSQMSGQTDSGDLAGQDQSWV